VKARVSKRRTCHKCRSKAVFSFAYFEPYDRETGPYTMWTEARQRYFEKAKRLITMDKPPLLVPLCRKCMGFRD
jgi:hypothetical protein